MKYRLFLTAAVLCFSTLISGARLSAQALASPEPEWLSQMLQEGWEKVQEGVLQRGAGGGRVETFTYGQEGLRWTADRLQERISALEYERSTHPSEEVDRFLSALQNKLTQTETSLSTSQSEPQGESLDESLPWTCEPLFGYSANADPLTGDQAPGVAASADAFFFGDNCVGGGELGHTYAYAYARATTGSTMSVRFEEDSKNSGTSLQSTATASVRGSLDCFSDAIASVSRPSLNFSYSVEDTNYECPDTTSGLSILSPAEGASVATSFRVSVVKNTTQPTSSIVIELDGKAISQDYNVESVDWMVSAPPGPHTLIAKTWYTDGTSISTQRSFTVINPAVTISTPVEGSTYSTPVRVLAHENTYRNADSMKLYLDGVEGPTISQQDLYDALIEAAPGTHQLMVKSWYSDGSSNNTTVSFIVRDGKVTITSPVQGATVGSPIHLVANESSNRSAASMKVYLDDGVVHSVSNSDTVDIYVNATAGSRRLTVKAWYSDGTVSERSLTVTVR